MYSLVETPFQYRHCCWFCNEPAAKVFEFPQYDNYVVSPTHPSLAVRCCSECFGSANKSKVNSIWLVFNEVKRFLIKKYHKDLAIGINWTQEELNNSQFESGNFAGFQKSAWFMYEVAKARVNFNGWPLIINGINIDEAEYSVSRFIFDGVEYPSYEDAITHYAKTFILSKEFFRKVLSITGLEKFAYAVRFCRLLVGATPNEREAALKELDHS